MTKVFCISAIILLLGGVLAGCPSATTTTPSITSFAINNGDASTNDPAITLNNTCTGIPTQYMASESSGFTGASWQTYMTAPSFTLSSGIGTKTVYVKVKNTAGESAAVSDTIMLNEYTVTEETILLPGNVPLTMAWCPAGTFMMGATATEQDSTDSEKPQHQVTLTQGFWMGKYELTQAQWKAVMNGTTPSYFQGDNQPVEQVSWNQAQSFIAVLNTLTSKTFRLPSEAEWEYACRAGTTTRFYWGDDATYSQIGNYAWLGDNSGGTTHDVGKKLPNAWGLYDMIGNVLEWCQDWYGEYAAGVVTNPTGPTSGSSRMLRGASWPYLDLTFCRSTYRYTYPPDSVYLTYGFRLVRTP